MKILVKDLVPNPFRKIKQYPIDKIKIESLKVSINETSFWDNLLARKDKDKFEIAYGHHRLIALQELKIKEIDIPVRELSDAMMIKIMADENLEWNSSPAVVCETIAAVKEFLDSKITKYYDLKALNRAGEFTGSLFKNEGNFQEVKEKGVGRATIQKFLGKNWKGWVVREALAMVKDKTLNYEAIKTIPTIGQAREFKNNIKRYNVSKPKQKKLAERIKEEGIGMRDIPKVIQDSVKIPKKKEQDLELQRIKEKIEKINSKAASLCGTIIGFNAEMKKLDVKQLGGIKSFFVVSSIADLLPAIKELLKFFGFDFKQLLLKGKSNEKKD